MGGTVLCQHVPIDRQRQPASVFVGVFAGAPHTALVLGENIKEVCNSLHVYGHHGARLSEVGGGGGGGGLGVGGGGGGTW